MKLGLSYNLFDGEELLKSSILSVRDNCDYINIIYQKVSNLGNPCSNNVLDLLNDLRKESLIDQAYLFEPDLSLPAGKNEIKKRNIGLKLAKQHGCSHFLSIDTDEFYDREQFLKAPRNILQKPRQRFQPVISWATTSKNPYIRWNLLFYCVPFISKKSKYFSKFRESNQFPVLVDPSRKLNGKRFKYFEPDKLVMHHMTYVRTNLEVKFNNSSGKDTFVKSDVVEILNEWRYPNDWIDPTIHYVDPKAKNVFRVSQVPNKFNIHLDRTAHS